MVILVVSAETIEDWVNLEITPEEFRERFPGIPKYDLDLLTLSQAIKKPMNSVSEVLRSQCMHPYCVDYVVQKVTFSSETDAITCSAMLEVLI